MLCFYIAQDKCSRKRLIRFHSETSVQGQIQSGLHFLQDFPRVASPSPPDNHDIIQVLQV